MKTIVLWALLAVPTQQCLDKVQHDNVGPCHKERRMGDSGYFFINGQPYGSEKEILVCDPVPNPKPMPQEKVLFTTDKYALKDDDCYEVYHSSFELTTAPFFSYSSFASTAGLGSNVFISSVVYRTPAVVGRPRDPEGKKKTSQK